MENKIYMLSTQSCTRCPIVKSQLADKNVDVEYVDVEETPDIAVEHGIMSVPAIIDNRQGDDTVYKGKMECMQFVRTLG